MQLKTVLEVLEKQYPEAIKNWDGSDYRIVAPVSVDDEPHIQVILINKKGSFIGCKLELKES